MGPYNLMNWSRWNGKRWRRCVSGLAILAITSANARATVAQPPSAQQKPVTVRGKTYVLDQKGYREVDGITIQAIRSGPLLDPPVKSDADGKFEFEVSDGEPFRIEFTGQTQSSTDLIPEVRQVAGKDGTDNMIHVALYTPDEYRRRFGPDALRRKLECTKCQSDEGSDVYRIVNQIFGRFF